jgi:hypothetical protein
MKIRSQERLQTVGELYRLLYTSKRKTPVKKQPKETKPKKKIGWLAACAAAVIVAAVLLIPQKQEPTVSIQVPETTEATTPTTTVPETTLPELSPEERSYREAEALEDAGEYGKAAIAFGKLGDYADSRERSFALWETIAHRETLPTNWTKQDNRWDKVFVALKNDGTVLSDPHFEGSQNPGYHDLHHPGGDDPGPSVYQGLCELSSGGESCRCHEGTEIRRRLSAPGAGQRSEPALHPSDHVGAG